MTKARSPLARPSRVDLTMVSTFKAIIDTGKVSRAAEVLGVTQPSVSQNLRRLREYFGDQLFVRSGNTLQPTARAISLEPLVSRLVRDIDLISQPPADFNPGAANREFIVCLSDIAESFVLPRLTAVFSRVAPGCSLRGRRVLSTRLLTALEKGEIDLAAGTLVGADPSLRQQRIGEYELICMTSAHGRWVDKALTRQDLAECRHVEIQRISDIVDPVTERLRKKGIHRSVALSVANHFAAAGAVASADLLCIVPRHVGEHLATMFPLKVQPLPIDIGGLPNRLLWHERFHKDPAHAWLRRVVEDAYRYMLVNGEKVANAAD